MDFISVTSRSANARPSVPVTPAIPGRNYRVNGIYGYTNLSRFFIAYHPLLRTPQQPL
jgi:hypothetical protein